MSFAFASASIRKLPEEVVLILIWKLILKKSSYSEGAFRGSFIELAFYY